MILATCSPPHSEFVFLTCNCWPSALRYTNPMRFLSSKWAGLNFTASLFGPRTGLANTLVSKFRTAFDTLTYTPLSPDICLNYLYGLVANISELSPLNKSTGLMFPHFYYISVFCILPSSRNMYFLSKKGDSFVCHTT